MLTYFYKALSNRKISVIASRSRTKRGDDETGCGHLLHTGHGLVWTARATEEVAILSWEREGWFGEA